MRWTVKIKQLYSVHIVGHILNITLLSGLCISGIAQAGDVFKGAETYTIYCQNCHAADGQGVLPNAPDFTRGEGLFRTDLEVYQIIRAGKGVMPGFEGLLSEHETLNVIAHLRSLQR